MIPVKPALSYFRDCYRLDTRTTKLDNFFGRKVEQRYVLDGPEQLLNRELPYLPLKNEIGEKLSAVLQFYSKEKAVYYCSLFMVGYGLSAMGKRQRFCVPVFMHEAEFFRDDEGYAIRITPEKRIINVDVLSFLKKEEGDLRSYISRELPAETFDFGSITKLQKILSEGFNDLKVEDLLLYPQLATEKQIKKIYNQPKVKEGEFRLIPAAGIALMTRSDNTQGIMTELGEMGDLTDNLPSSIMALFGHKVTADLPKTTLGYVPAMLNSAQQKIIENAQNHHLSVAIGPPGTGKSFTIASLAIEFMSRGESVLVVSKTDQAVDVIDHKIAKDLKIANTTVRAGKKDYLRQLKARIEDILNGLRYWEDKEEVQSGSKKVLELKYKIDRCERKVTLAKDRYMELLAYEQRWGDDLAKATHDPNILRAFKRKYINWRTSKKEPHWTISEDYLSALLERVTLIRERVDLLFQLNIKKVLLTNRGTLRQLWQALRARTSNKRELMFEQLDFQALFGTLPIWLCKLSDLHQVLPFKQELFDVVIIDEATQCDIASCLPAIYRAKRVVIVGDPKQLRHVSFLSTTAQYSLQQKYDLEDHSAALDYRDLSILDFIDIALDSQDQLTLLNEHYRSLPDLISFSNEHFYHGGLSIMNVISEDHSTRNIHHRPLEGTRSVAGANEEEASEMLKHLLEIIKEESELPQSMCRSLGVLSPFRAQVDHMNLIMMENLPSEAITRHDILCGTAHSFQGEERDVMLLSFCLDNEGHATGFRHINRPDVFNVSITRAKSAIFVYTSFEMSKLKQDAYLRMYLEAAQRPPIKQKASTMVHDHFLAEVKEILVKEGKRVRVGYEVADLSLDLAVINSSELVAIDLIGYPGAFEEGLSLASYKVLHRAGIRTFPLPYSFWHLDKERCTAALFAFLKEPSEPQELS